MQNDKSTRQSNIVTAFVQARTAVSKLCSTACALMKSQRHFSNPSTEPRFRYEEHFLIRKRDYERAFPGREYTLAHFHDDAWPGLAQSGASFELIKKHDPAFVDAVFACGNAFAAGKPMPLPRPKLILIAGGLRDGKPVAP